MTQPLGTLTHLATDVLTLPVRVAARAYGMARGTVSEARRAAAGDGPDPGRPVNVVERLGLDPAPVPRRRVRRTPAVTAIDRQAEPRLVESTPADVARRIDRAREG